MTPNDALKAASDALRKASEEKQTAQDLIKNLGVAVVDTLKPVLDELSRTSKQSQELIAELKPALEDLIKNAKVSNQEMVDAVSKINITVPNIDSPNIPEIKIPEFKIPQPIVNVAAPVIPPIKLPEFPKIPPIKVPKAEVTVKIPEIKIPNIIMPDEMDVKGWVGFMGYDKSFLKNPLPVQLRDSQGNPVKLFDNLTQVLSGGGGAGIGSLSQVGGRLQVDVISQPPASASVTIADIFATTQASVVVNPDNRVRVELPAGATGLTDIELRASHLDVQQLSGAIWSVSASLDTTQTLYNADNRLRVSVETGGSGLTDTELRASHLDVVQMSGTIDSVFVTGIFNSTSADILNADNRMKVELPATTITAVTDVTNSVRILTLPETLQQQLDNLVVRQVSGFADSVNIVTVSDIFSTTTASTVVTPDNRVKVDGSGVTQPISVTDIFATTAASNVVNADNRVKVELPATTIATTQSGAWDVDNTGTFAIQVQDSQASTISSHIFATDFRALDVYLGGATASTFSELLNPDGRVKVELAATTISGITNTVFARLDNPDGAYSAANPFPVTLISGGLTSTIAVGAVASDAIDDGSAPIKTGGIARTANPTAVSGGDTVTFSADKIGRTITRPVQVRDLIATAYLSLANGTETTLLAAGGAGVFLDCISVMCSNSSDVAVMVDFRDVTGGGINFSIEVPASGPGGIAHPVPWPQGSVNNNWTADMPDITGTVVNIAALFSKEV